MGSQVFRMSNMIPVLHVVFLFLPTLVLSDSTTISLEDYQFCTSSTTHDVYENDEYLVTWNGKRMGTVCTLEFDNKVSDRKLCIKAESYSVSDCDVEIKFNSKKTFGTKSKSYSCFDSPSEYCGDFNEDLEIEVDATGFSIFTIFDNSFKLKVYSKEENYSAEIGAGTGTVVVLIIIIVVLVIVVKKKKFRFPMVQVQQPVQQPTVIINTTQSPGPPAPVPAVQAPPQYFPATQNW